MSSKFLLLFVVLLFIGLYSKGQVTPSINKKSGTPILRIQILGGSFKDEVIIYSNDKATENYDRNIDALKLFGAPTAPQIYCKTTDGAKDLTISAIKVIEEGIKVRLFLLFPEEKKYQLKFVLKDFLSHSVYIKDLTTGEINYGVDTSVAGIAGEVREYELGFRDGVYWTGKLNSEWTKPENWFNNTLPNADREALIVPTPSGTYPTVSTLLIPDYNITINKGTQLTIAPNGVLNTRDVELTNLAGTEGIILESLNDGSGQLIAKTDLLGTVQYTIKAGVWMPLSVQTDDPTTFNFIGNAPAEFLVKAYTEKSTIKDLPVLDVENYWKEIAIEEVTQNQAYLVQASEDAVFEFKGRILGTNSDYTFSMLQASNMTGTTVNNGWHLLPNPYSSGLIADASWFPRLENMNGAVYYFDGVTVQSLVLATGVGEFDGYIKKGGSFFMKVTDHNGSVTIPAKNKTFENNESTYPTTDAIDVEISNNNVSSKAIAYIKANTSKEFDASFDAFHLYGNVTKPQLFWETEKGEKLSINAMSSFSDGLVLNCKAIVPETGSYVLRVKNHEFIDYPIYIYDAKDQKTIEATELVIDGVEGEERHFSLLFGNKALSTSLINSNDPDIIISGNYLRVENKLNNIYTCMVYSVLGELMHQITTSGSNIIYLKSGSYVVVMKSERNHQTKKIIVH